MSKRFGLLSLVPILLIFSLGCNTNSKTSNSNEKNQQISDIINTISEDSLENYVQTLAGFETRHSMSDTASDSIGIGAARRWIHSKFQDFSQKSGGRLEVKYDSYIEEESSRLTRPTEIVNVMAVLPGTQLESKNRMYVVSGHYDTIVVPDMTNDSTRSPGAVDDASGVAAVMEMARVMSEYKFDATVVFMAVAGEEQGLLGSSYYAQKAKKKNLNIAGMVTNDIVGSPKAEDGRVTNGIRVFAQGIPPVDTLSRYQKRLLYTGGENDTPPRQLARLVHDVAEIYMPDFNVNMIYRKDRYLRGGDHSSFLEQGYPAVRFTQPHEDYKYQHQKVRKEEGVQYGDLPKFVDYQYISKVAQLNSATFATLANAPARPKEVGMVVENLTNNTTLEWAANSEPDLKGYEVVWRKTHAPYWEHSAFVEDSTRYTVPDVSKDNYLFGVRSVDKFGNKSPAVYPLP